MSALISVRALSKTYASPGGQVLTVLSDLELTAVPGEMIAIVGASGVGKSTLLHVLGGLDEFDAGEIEIGGQAVHTMTDTARVEFRNRHVGFVFQFHHLLPEFTALENVEMPMRIARAGAAVRCLF
ncbi:MAG: ATP-binding cassette domain-containing protein [Acidobacteria bacterium]|nr:ATP-binding cassette domain-containing protein [Acidobacteriota bacterium]